MLEFQPITFDLKTLVDFYTFKYGEGSCQHSFVSSWCLHNKYGDMFCERDNFLYTLRSKQCTENHRVYLFPHGDTADTKALKQALQNILDDAHEHNARVRFETLTSRAKDIVCEMLPGKFAMDGNRDLSEYIYSAQGLSQLTGHEYTRLRQYIHAFERDNEGRYTIKSITPEDISRLWEFECAWHSDRTSENSSNALYLHQIDSEKTSIKTELDNFSRLGLSGITMSVDDELAGFAYGFPLSEKYFDIITGKGRREVKYVYCVLLKNFAAMCCKDYDWINLEEDIGVPGIRTMKAKYKPSFMIEKFVLTEL